MKRKLTWGETLSITSMLFGMFFGAGNLIFPAKMGQMAGWNLWPAFISMFITGVGLPLLGVAALGISRSNGLQALSSKVGKGYGYFFTCALYLTIGPFFAIPRCATVPFSIGIAPLVGGETGLTLVIYSVIFFALVLVFSLFPGRIMTWIGRILNPVFLVLLGVLTITALVNPVGSINNIEPAGGYASQPFFKGFLEGYNTMDALASLAFGIVVVNVIRGRGVEEPGAVAGNTVRAGVFSCLMMGAIYLAITVACGQLQALFTVSENGEKAKHVLEWLLGSSEAAEKMLSPEMQGSLQQFLSDRNGGEVLAMLAHHYFGSEGALILAGVITFACMKTAIGLITSCSETFCTMMPKGPSYRVWAVIFCVVSLLIANLGLSTIIDYSVPVLMFLYPLAITLILLALLGRFFDHSRKVYAWVTGCTLAAAVLDLVNALPAATVNLLHLDGVIAFAKSYVPLFKLGLGWVCPALLGLGIGLICYFSGRKDAPQKTAQA